MMEGENSGSFDSTSPIQHQDKTLIAKRKNIMWPGGPAKKQRFSLPDGITYGMARNPISSKAYLKQAMSCKYFFETKPLLIVRRIHGDVYCSSKNAEECDNMDHKCCVTIDLAKIAGQIWFCAPFAYEEPYISSTFNAALPEKIYEKAECYMFAGVVFEDFKMLASRFEHFEICAPLIQKEIVAPLLHPGMVMLEDIVGALPYIKKFKYTFWGEESKATCSNATIKNLCKLSNLGDLRHFCMEYVPEFCDPKDFAELIMKHSGTKFWFKFGLPMSAEFKAKLDELCDIVINTGASNCVIIYFRQDKKKLGIMLKRQKK